MLLAIVTRKTGCRLSRVAFMEVFWSVEHYYGTQSEMITGLNRPPMQEHIEKLDEYEGGMSELFVDSAYDERDTNSLIKQTRQEKMMK